jgi:uncharacterized protein YbgA (DUF1722 family)/uncharacterized protein YbbK (DUF523 family)
LGKYVEFVPVCPEVECGLGVPREAMRLVGDPEAPRLVTRSTGVDLTDRMVVYAGKRVEALAGENLCGFVFKAKSPSSGMERVKIYNEKGAVAGWGAGLFARAFMQRFPLLPVEDEGRLCDPDLRENFVERIFALNRYREAVGPGAGMKDIIKFHEQNKFLLHSHNETVARRMGRLLGTNVRARDKAGVRAQYEAELLEALKCKATPSRHANVLQHMMGFFKDMLPSNEKQEMLELIDEYRGGMLPLIVPVTLMKHFVRKYRVAYLQEQTYLNPHPLEMKLRNHS